MSVSPYLPEEKKEVQKTGGLVQTANKTGINLSKASLYVDVSGYRSHETVNDTAIIQTDITHDVGHSM